MSRVVERFLQYVEYNTQSDENSDASPSTSGQLVLGEALKKELEELGLENVRLTETGYVYGVLSANTTKEQVPAIGFIAHMDTSSDMPGEGVKPQIIQDYPGGDIVLSSEKGITLSPEEFPELNEYVGKTLITTDGTTLLGADDKAGIAEIITAVEYLIEHPEIPHGKICVAFTPDEEIGRGADHFDVSGFGADFAYTLDGGPIGELEYENFNAAKAKVFVQGESVHPGTAKDKMLNSMLLAAEYMAQLPANETPAHTEGYEGFYHLTNISGNVETTTMSYIIRDFDWASFEHRKQVMQAAAHSLNQKYGRSIFSVAIEDQYYNMKEKIEPVQHVVRIAEEAMQSLGIAPVVVPVRGGTDGARLSYMGLPCPNLFGGGHAFHGKYEFIPTFAMEKAVAVIVKIAELYAR